MHKNHVIMHMCGICIDFLPGQKRWLLQNHILNGVNTMFNFENADFCGILTTTPITEPPDDRPAQTIVFAGEES